MTPRDHSAIRDLARGLDGRFAKRRALTLARDLIETGVRATLAKHLSGDLDDARTPLFAEALAACEGASA